MLEIFTFGPPRIILDGKPVTSLPSRAAEGLLIYLACGDQPMRREFLAELLWSERTQKQALANLRSVLSSLRRALGDYLIITRQTVAFNREAEYRLDAHEFERLIGAIGPIIESTTPLETESVARLEQATRLYRGEFLEGFYLREGRGFEEWAALSRERLRRLAHGSLRRLARHYLENRAFKAGIQVAERLIAIDPFDERSRRQMMWLLVRGGRPNAALQQYEELRGLLAAELDVPPAPVTQALYRRIKNLQFPPPHNIPNPATPFLGREQELEELEAHLKAAETRLVTLLGPGGIGKTRLGLEAARRIVQKQPGYFLDGVFFIPLAAVNDVRQLPDRIAEAARIEMSGGDPLKGLVEQLREREMLLILDNYEHLLEAGSNPTGLLENILANAAQVKLLVTSRERLNLYEEVAFDVPGLAVPTNGEQAPQEYSAVALFMQNARRIHRHFQASPEEFAAITHACRLLDGMPLAIELAAGWVRQHTCEEIAEQIETDLDFLRSTLRNVPERHRSLRSVFEHSWRLLSPQEQAVFSQLTVFEGGFTLDAVEAVISFRSSVFNEEHTGLRPQTSAYRLRIAGWLASLADKSLLHPQENGRYDIHPIMRQFAAEKQAEITGVLDHVPQNHARYFLRLAAGQDRGDAPEQQRLLTMERANIEKAWHTAARTGLYTQMQQAAAALHGFYSVQSRFQEGIRLFEEALHQISSRERTPPQLVCDLLARKARMHIHIGQLQAAQIALQRAQQYLDHLDDPAQRSRVLDSLAIASYYAGDYSQALLQAQESLRISAEEDNQEGIAFSLNFMGSCAKAQGDYRAARTYFERSIHIARQNQDELGVAMTLNNLGNLLQLTGDLSQAHKCYLESSELLKAHDHIHGAATTLANAGQLAAKQGDYEQARQLLTESLEMKRAINDQRGVAVALTGLANVALARDDYAATGDQLLQALEFAQQCGDTKLTLTVLAGMAALRVKQGRRAAATRLLALLLNHPGTSEETRQEALRLVDELGSQPDTIRAVWQGESLDDVIAEVVKGGGKG